MARNVFKEPTTGCPEGCDDLAGQCVCPPTPTPSAPPPPSPTPTSTPTGCGFPEYATDGDCDDENNNAGCDWDGGACVGTTFQQFFVQIVNVLTQILELSFMKSLLE